MQTTLTELRRDTHKVVRHLYGGKTVALTQHGQVFAEIVPCPPIDRKAALDLLRQIGPLELPPRQ